MYRFSALMGPRRRAAGWTLGLGLALLAGAAAVPAVEANAPEVAAVDEAAHLAPSAAPGDGAYAANIPDGRLSFEYEMFLGGFKLGRAEFKVDFSGEAYTAESFLETKGLAEFFFESRYRVNSTGDYLDGLVSPRSYHSDFVGDGKTQIVRIPFEEGMPGETFADPSYEERIRKYPVSDALKRNTVDPLSALLHMMAGSSVTAEDPCGTTVPVFDGRRRYNLKLDYEGTRDVKVRGGKVYEGEVMVCTMTYEPVAGYKPKDMARDVDEMPIPPTEMWVAERAGGILTPVRMRIKTPFGSGILIMDEFSLELEPQAAALED